MKKQKEKWEGEEEEEEEDENPFVFDDRDFDTTVDTEDGRFLVLQNFPSKSKLLRDVEKYGLAILEARAHAFVSPHHFDSEAILFNVKGIISSKMIQFIYIFLPFFLLFRVTIINE